MQIAIECGQIAMMFPEPHFIETNGIRMAVYEQGDGPAVVLLHGFPELAFSWRHQLPALAGAGYRAIAPDQRREALLRGVAAALKRIDNGDYGTCIACDEPIAAKRLEFDPAVERCVDCASRLEQDEAE